MTIQLRTIANARCGDKGNKVNIAVFAKDAKDYDILLDQVTPERVAAHFKDLVFGEVKRYEVPTIYALNFVLSEALDGGGSASLRVDNLGKCFASNLMRMEINGDDNEVFYS